MENKFQLYIFMTHFLIRILAKLKRSQGNDIDFLATMIFLFSLLLSTYLKSSLNHFDHDLFRG